MMSLLQQYLETWSSLTKIKNVKQSNMPSPKELALNSAMILQCAATIFPVVLGVIKDSGHSDYYKVLMLAAVLLCLGAFVTRNFRSGVVAGGGSSHSTMYIETRGAEADARARCYVQRSGEQDTSKSRFRQSVAQSAYEVQRCWCSSARRVRRRASSPSIFTNLRQLGAEQQTWNGLLRLI